MREYDCLPLPSGMTIGQHGEYKLSTRITLFWYPSRDRSHPGYRLHVVDDGRTLAVWPANRIFEMLEDGDAGEFRAAPWRFAAVDDAVDYVFYGAEGLKHARKLGVAGFTGRFDQPMLDRFRTAISILGDELEEGPAHPEVDTHWHWVVGPLELHSNQRRIATGFRHLDRLPAAVYGFAVGDALGVPYEFRDRNTFHCEDMTGHGTHDQPPGTWSDDTSMMLATLDSLAAYDGRVCPDDIRRRYLKWLHDGAYAIDGHVFDVGGTVRQALQTGEGLSGETDCGNGSLMRVLPLAFTHASDDAIFVMSAVTHAHPRCTDACVDYVRMCRLLLDGETFAYDAPDRDSVPSTGYVLDTMQAVLWAVAAGHDYPSTVLNAVNLGGDTDTVAALAGGVAGILYGMESIPDEWLDMLRGRDIINDVLEHAGAMSGRESKVPEPAVDEPSGASGISLLRRLRAMLSKEGC